MFLFLAPYLSRSVLKRLYLFKIGADFLASFFKLITGLEVHPEFGRCAKILGKPKRRISANALLFTDDTLQSRAFYLTSLRERVGSNTKRLHKFLAEDFPGV